MIGPSSDALMAPLPVDGLAHRPPPVGSPSPSPFPVCQGPPAHSAPLTHIRPLDRSTWPTNNLRRQTLDFRNLRVLGVGPFSCITIRILGRPVLLFGCCAVPVSAGVCCYSVGALCVSQACVAIRLLRCASVGRRVLLFGRCAVPSLGRRVLLLGGSCRVLRTTSPTAPLSPHCERRPVRGGIRASCLNGTEAGCDDPIYDCCHEHRGPRTESPRREASPSERATILEDENSQLRETVVALEGKVSFLESEISLLSSEMEDCRHVIQELTGAFEGNGIADMRREMEQMSIQIGLLQCAVSNAPVVAHDVGARLRIPEPKAYGGARDAKEVENFLFDMEQYFLAANVVDEARKVSTATMYLTGDAKLWWRTKYAEIQANQVRLDTWDLLREAIIVQFFPENVEYNSRRALRKLEHTGSMQDYVKSFSVLMLDIRDMSEKDKLFKFMEGLKPWARIELQRQRVTDLGSAMTAAERLIDFASETRRDRQTTPSPAQNKAGGTKSFRSNSNRGGETESPTLRLVRRAVQTGTSPRRTDRGRHRGAAGASCATARTDIGTARRNSC
ncbi:UNVERIFIED_CONTAM: hypothetical protein Sradi_0183900 [Sesamum radiatum]|uniref:Retrotransposon gag domain-containing protein n=1 Tax=Sesamum radiatum TaxID=300843 RepID=A0AAW2W3R6_SESRA